jgi:ABC-type lipoprotein release transport system permease subunit
MHAVWFVARTEVRKRWTGVVVLAVLVGIAGGAVLAAAAGARRTATALTRFEEASRTATFELEAGEVTREQLRELRAVPEVEGVGVLWQMAIVNLDAGFLPIAAPKDSSFGRDVDLPRLVEGRVARAADELNIGESLAARLGLRVGDRFPFQSFTQEQIDTEIGTNEFDPRGPDVDFRVVGIVRRPLDLGVRGEAGGVVVPTLAFYEAYRDRIGTFSGTILRVRTEHGESDATAIRRAVRRILGPGHDFETLGLEGRGARSAIDVMTAGLWILAGITALAATVAVGLAMARRMTDATASHDTLAALGLRRRQRWAASTLLAAPVAVGGALLAVVAALLASPLFPRGVAAKADPDPGLRVDSLVLVAGFVVLAAGVLCLGALAAWLATRRPVATRARVPMSARTVAGFDLPPPVGVGLGFALDRGRGRHVVPVWSAIAAAVLAVAGVVAAGSFGTSLDRLVNDPARFGWTWDAALPGVDLPESSCSAGSAVRDDPAVEAAASLCYGDVSVEDVPAIGWSFRSERGAIEPTIVSGRAPRTKGEVALGRELLRGIGRSVGDTITVRMDEGRPRFRIVGTFVMPGVGDAQPIAASALFTVAGMERGKAIDDDTAVVTLRAAASRAGFDRRTAERNGGANAIAATVPAEVERLRQIDALPFALGVLVVVIGLIALSYTLVVTVRRRSPDIAILKTIGFARRQVRSAVAWQASTVGIVGLVVGVVAGIVVGQVIWRAVANDLGVDPRLSVPVAGFAFVLVPVTLVVVNGIAAIPAAMAARTPPAVVLRAE